jgi:hypothetical protein
MSNPDAQLQELLQLFEGSEHMDMITHLLTLAVNKLQSETSEHDQQTFDVIFMPSDESETTSLDRRP